MFQLITSLVLASLIFPSSFNFLTEKAVDFSYAPVMAEPTLTPQRLATASLGIETTAENILVVDEASAKVLYTKNSGAVAPIASLTKLLTALVFLDHNPGWDKTVTIIQADQRAGGRVYLLPGEEVNLKDLFYLMLVASSNEAAAALARATDLENFATAMNQKAAVLGLSDSTFVEPTGLSVGNVASPADLVGLAKIAFSQTDIAQAVTQKNYEFTVQNSGRLVRAESTDQLLASFLNADSYQIIGAKTGFLEEAGYCLVLRVQRDGHGIIVVLLGAKDQASRWQEALGLVDWIFSNYQWPAD